MSCLPPAESLDSLDMDARAEAHSALNSLSGDPLVVLGQGDEWFRQLHVLRDINLSISRGEVVVVIGPSGSGKSTLCRAINRLEPIDDGVITVDGQPLPAGGGPLAA